MTTARQVIRACAHLLPGHVVSCTRVGCSAKALSHSTGSKSTAKGCATTPELVRVDRDRDPLLAQEQGEEGSGRFGLSMTLKVHVQDHTVFFDGPPRPVSSATDVQMP